MNETPNEQAYRLELLKRDVDELRGRMMLKDEAIKGFSDANKALADQFRARWTPVQVASAALAALFALTFGYTILKTENIERLNKEMTDEISHLQNAKRELEEGARAQADVVAIIALALSESNEGYRKASQERFAEAAVIGKRMIDALEGAKTLVRDVDARHRVGRHAGEVKDAPFEASEIVNPLDKAINNAMFAAKGLYALSKFSIGEYEVAAQTAGELIQLDSKRYEGYHYRAISGEHTGRSRPEIIDDYAKSASLKDGPNVDLINLAELYFVSSDFPNAAVTAGRYLATDSAPTREFKAALLFLQNGARFAMGQIDDQELAATLAEMKKLHPKFSDDNYDLTKLTEYQKGGLQALSSQKVKAALGNIIDWMRAQQ
jgi:hypothetical protein